MKTTGLEAPYEAIFKGGSTTYFNSSLFFPPTIRRDVFILYGFVRTADDLVDAVPQDRDGFLAFRNIYERVQETGVPSGNSIIDNFVDLAQRKSFDPTWVQAFLDAMEADLSVAAYEGLEDVLKYIHGSAEVIGYFMARIMDLPDEALAAARDLGRSMQYINFIRDIAEDNALGRTYLPLAGSGLASLAESEARKDPVRFSSFIRHQAGIYLEWQSQAERGFRFIPHRIRIPVVTASRMYNWTARKIQKKPMVVFERKVKPGKFRIVCTAVLVGVQILLGIA